MKLHASLCALLLAACMPGFASAHHAGLNPHNQFHFKPIGARAAAEARTAPAATTHGLNKVQTLGPKVLAPVAQHHSASGKNVRRHTANPPTGKIGFVSALQIPAGGADWNVPSLPGDFNGDGKTDITTIVENYDTNTSSNVYSISVVLSNGNGTFQPAVLTAVPGSDTCPQIVVGDVNGDRKSDIIVVHQPNSCGNSYSVPTFDVLLSNGDGTFTASANANNTISATGLLGGTLADVNGDGKLDIVTIDQNNPAGVWTLLGNGDGTFQTPTSVSLSGQVGSNTIIADLNGDGFLDIAYTDSSTSQVTVYLATSASTYGPAAAYATSDSTYNVCSMTVGDLSGDAKPEIVTSNCSQAGNDLTVYLNNGDGTFQTGVYYDAAMSGGTNSGPAGTDSEAVTIADVNGDGKADIVSSNYRGGDVTVLLGNGDGTVNVPTIGYAIGGYPWAPSIVADFNGDGLADILVPDSEFSFAYLKGYGDGTFRSALNYYAATTGSSNTYNVSTGDFNGDGVPDFVIGNSCYNCSTAQGITVFLSRPDGSLQPGVTYGNSSSMWFTAVADFNGDGKLDIAATDYNAGTVQIFNGDGTGNFTAGATYNSDLSSTQPYGVFVGDFNNDGSPDLAIANYYAPDVTILLNDGSGNFLAAIPTPLSFNAWQGVAVADLNGDGNLDLVVPSWYGTVFAVLLGNGDGTFQPEQDIQPGTASDPNAVVLADLNGDGKLDVAVALSNGGGQDIAVALGNGDGTFGTFTIVRSSLQDFNLDRPFPQNIKALDVNGDGKLDLVYANTEFGTVGVLFGQGDGTFYDPVEYPVGTSAWGLAIADVNGDGAPDVVSSIGSTSGATVLLNNNGSATQPDFTVTAPQNSGSATAGGSATYNLVVTPSNLYNGTITFSCGTLPSKATCSFLPATVTPNGNGQWGTQLTINTTATTTTGAALHMSPRSGSPMMLATFSGIGVFGLFFAGSFKKNRAAIMIAMLVFVMMITLVGCGSNTTNTSGGGSTTVPGTPAGSYTVVVTASGTNGSTTTTHAFNLNLTVQ